MLFIVVVCGGAGNCVRGRPREDGCTGVAERAHVCVEDDSEDVCTPRARTCVCSKSKKQVPIMW